jgi:hypothetical protein
MELKPTDLILRRREAPSRRMAAGSVWLVAVLRDARKSALLRTRLTDASISFEPRKRSDRGATDKLDTDSWIGSEVFRPLNG